MLVAELTITVNRQAGISMDQRREFANRLGQNAHKLGDLLLAAAQRIVPYDTGNLHSSANIQYLSNGFRITYDTLYAFPLHVGESIDETMTGRNYKALTRQHKRRLANGKTVNVSRHTKTYKTGYKHMLTKLGVTETWKAIDVTREYTPNPWLRRAWDMVVSRLSVQEQQMVKDYLVIERGDVGYDYERF